MAVLEARYTRYRMSSDLAQAREFRIDTSFLSLINDRPSTEVATLLTKTALKDFSSLSVDSILAHDPNIQLLGSQWDRLCHDAEEIAAVEDLASKLLAVAKVEFETLSFVTQAAD